MQKTVVARDEFFLNVRTAVSPLLPIVDEAHPYTEKKDLKIVLRGSNDWLSKQSVEGYQSRDFEDLGRETREALDRNVEAFLEVASKVGPKKPAKPAQVDAALPPFLEVISIVRKLLLDDWLEAARGLIDQASEWAEAEGWPTKRYRWTLTEGFIGTYELDRLIYGVAGSQMALIPAARFSPGAEGMFDLAVMPVYEAALILRRKGTWHIHPSRGERKSRSWSKPAFVETSERLARLA